MKKQKKISMKRIRFGDLFHDNQFLKLFSVFAAIIVWFIVALNVSPTITKVIKDVPVTISSEGLGMEAINTDTIKIDLVVKGKRYVVGSLKETDFYANAVIEDVKGPGTYTLPLRVSKKTVNTEYEIVSYPTTISNVRFDSVVTREFELESDVSGIKIADGYIKSKSTTQPTKISVTGPETELSSVTRCVAKAELSDQLTQTVTVGAKLLFYDASGNLVASDHFKRSSDTVQVTVPVLKTKELPIEFNYVNTPTGLDVSKLSYSLSNETIELAGPSDRIDSLSSLNIGYVDFKKLDLNGEMSFDVVLPTGFVNVNNVSKIKVKFDTTGFESKQFTISDIKAVNVPEGYTVSVVTTSIPNVTVITTKENMATLAATDLVVEIDMGAIEIAQGRLTTPVKIYAPSKGQLWAIGEYTVAVQVNKG